MARQIMVINSGKSSGLDLLLLSNIIFMQHPTTDPDAPLWPPTPLGILSYTLWALFLPLGHCQQQCSLFQMYITEHTRARM